MYRVKVMVLRKPVKLIKTRYHGKHGAMVMGFLVIRR